jgi:hypothetical protein
MVVVPLTQSEKDTPVERRGCGAEGTSWARIAAGGTLLASGLLLLTGNRRAGLATAAAGTALALLDQQEAVRAVWDALPGYIDDVQHLLSRVEDSVAEVSLQRERLHRVLNR